MIVSSGSSNNNRDKEFKRNNNKIKKKKHDNFQPNCRTMIMAQQDSQSRTQKPFSSFSENYCRGQKTNSFDQEFVYYHQNQNQPHSRQQHQNKSVSFSYNKNDVKMRCDQGEKLKQTTMAKGTKTINSLKRHAPAVPVKQHCHNNSRAISECTKDDKNHTNISKMKQSLQGLFEEPIRLWLGKTSANTYRGGPEGRYCGECFSGNVNDNDNEDQLIFRHSGGRGLGRVPISSTMPTMTIQHFSNRSSHQRLQKQQRTLLQSTSQQRIESLSEVRSKKRSGLRNSDRMGKTEDLKKTKVHQNQTRHFDNAQERYLMNLQQYPQQHRFSTEFANPLQSSFSAMLKGTGKSHQKQKSKSKSKSKQSISSSLMLNKKQLLRQQFSSRNFPGKNKTISYDQKLTMISSNLRKVAQNLYSEKRKNPATVDATNRSEKQSETKNQAQNYHNKAKSYQQLKKNSVNAKKNDSSMQFIIDEKLQAQRSKGILTETQSSKIQPKRSLCREFGNIQKQILEVAWSKQSNHHQKDQEEDSIKTVQKLVQNLKIHRAAINKIITLRKDVLSQLVDPSQYRGGITDGYSQCFQAIITCSDDYTVKVTSPKSLKSLLIHKHKSRVNTVMKLPTRQSGSPFDTMGNRDIQIFSGGDDCMLRKTTLTVPDFSSTEFLEQNQRESFRNQEVWKLNSPVVHILQSQQTGRLILGTRSEVVLFDLSRSQSVNSSKIKQRFYELHQKCNKSLYLGDRHILNVVDWRVPVPAIKVVQNPQVYVERWISDPFSSNFYCQYQDHDCGRDSSGSIHECLNRNTEQVISWRSIPFKTVGTQWKGNILSVVGQKMIKTFNLSNDIRNQRKKVSELNCYFPKNKDDQIISSFKLQYSQKGEPFIINGYKNGKLSVKQFQKSFDN